MTPLARPGILASVPKWLVDPLGPLSLRIRDLPALTPWLMRFVKAARPEPARRSTAALARLMKSAIDDHRELARRGGLSGHMRRTGALHIFDTEATFRLGAVEWDERQAEGVAWDEVGPEEARRMVPALAGPFARAIFAPDHWTVSSPNLILQALRRRVGATGELAVREVVSLRPDPKSVAVLTADGGDLPFDNVVVAGGVWSRDIVRRLGLKVSLETERGYNTTFPHAPIDLPMPVFFDDHGFCATRLADGLRVGGAVELAAVEAPPNYARAAAMRKVMRRYVPDLPEAGGTEWMGCRPATPDSLPVIGADPHDPRIVFAFGHGHLGLTLSATTARHVAEIVSGRTDPMLTPFGIDRFQ